MGFQRQILKNKEIQELENIKSLYGKKPKEKCPICHKKSLFMTNDNGEIFCVRCDSKVAQKKK